ncbi:MAG TPA: hypothetical protein VGP47_00480 [Parachlamydiaceae bacterium]|nr:hypothetical protein [Parachlamydiaceae bacterium]
MTPATAPDARAAASMAFDQSSGKMILLGGQGNAGRLVTDLLDVEQATSFIQIWLR